MATSQGNVKGTTAHTEAEGHGKAGFPPFQKETFASQLVSFAIAFALLYFIVSKFALPRVGSILASREGMIENDLAEAQKLKDESDDALKAYETELANARARAQAIGTETRDKLNAQAESDRKVLESSLATKLADAEKTIAETRKTAMGNVRSIASDAASAIVQRLTGVTPDSKSVDSAVDTTLKG
jgi:F-type H+-transporting ATPase subunit b